MGCTTAERLQGETARVKDTVYQFKSASAFVSVRKKRRVRIGPFDPSDGSSRWSVRKRVAHLG